MKDGKDKYPDHLQHVETNYLDQQECKDDYPDEKISKNMMCTKKKDVDACQGDR